MTLHQYLLFSVSILLLTIPSHVFSGGPQKVDIDKTIQLNKKDLKKQKKAQVFETTPVLTIAPIISFDWHLYAIENIDPDAGTNVGRCGCAEHVPGSCGRCASNAAQRGMTRLQHVLDRFNCQFDDSEFRFSASHQGPASLDDGDNPLMYVSVGLVGCRNNIIGSMENTRIISLSNWESECHESDCNLMVHDYSSGRVTMGTLDD